MTFAQAGEVRVVRYNDAAGTMMLPMAPLAPALTAAEVDAHRRSPRMEPAIAVVLIMVNSIAIMGFAKRNE